MLHKVEKEKVVKKERKEVASVWVAGDGLHLHGIHTAQVHDMTETHLSFLLDTLKV